MGSPGDFFVFLLVSSPHTIKRHFCLPFQFLISVSIQQWREECYEELEPDVPRQELQGLCFTTTALLLCPSSLSLGGHHHLQWALLCSLAAVSSVDPVPQWHLWPARKIYLFPRVLWKCLHDKLLVCVELKGKGQSALPTVGRRMTSSKCLAVTNWLIRGLCGCAHRRVGTSVPPPLMRSTDVRMAVWTGLQSQLVWDSPGITGCGVLQQLRQALSRWELGETCQVRTFLQWSCRNHGASSASRTRWCWAVLSCPRPAHSSAAGCHVPCALLTEILIYAIRNGKNKEFEHSLHFAWALQWVSANSSAVVRSARNPREWLLSRGISSNLIAKL